MGTRIRIRNPQDHIGAQDVDEKDEDQHYVYIVTFSYCNVFILLYLHIMIFRFYNVYIL